MSAKRGRPPSGKPAGKPILIRLPEDEAAWLRAMADATDVGLATAGRTIMVQAIRERQASTRAAAPPPASA